MSRGETYSGRRSIPFKWIVLIIIAVLLIIFAAVFRVRIINITGNDHYTESQVRSMVMGRPLSSNTVVLALTNRNRKIEGESFAESINVRIESPWEVTVELREKAIAGYVFHDGMYCYFDKDGTVLCHSSKPESEDAVNYYPLVEDLPVETAKTGYKMTNVSSDILSEINNLRIYLNGREVLPDRVAYDEKYGIILTYGDFRAAMGTDPDVEDKIRQLYGILPESEGLKGMLHLEDYDGTKAEIVFKKD